jgi:hypothetical protein
LDRVIAAVKAGDYDEQLAKLVDAVRERQDNRKDVVSKLVREVFGPDAEVVTSDQVRWPSIQVPDLPEGPIANPVANPFLKKVEPPPEPTSDDPLANLDSVEQEMAKEDQPDIERRGAMISGLHSSDIE